MKRLWGKYSYTIMLVIISFVGAFVLSVHFQKDDETNYHYRTVTVTEGDSLWKLSEQYANDHQLSNEQFIRWVKRANGIKDGIIYAGETLVIPVQEDNYNTQVARAN